MAETELKLIPIVIFPFPRRSLSPSEVRMETERQHGNAVKVYRFSTSSHRIVRAIPMKRCLMTIAVAAALAAAAGSIERAHFAELNRKARELSGKKDWPGLRAALIEIGQEMPAPTPSYMLRMASV